MPLPLTTSLIHQGIHDRHHTGAQVSVSINEETVADIALGEARPGVPMQTDTLMPWLSCTKPLGAIIIGRMLEAGSADLENPVSRHIPEFGANGKEGVTLRHLLTHTGGFRLVDFDWQTESWNEILDRIYDSSLEPGWVPGEKAGYHKETGWYVLAEVIQRKTGRAFGDILREDLYEPLEMHDSWVVLPRERYAAYGDRIGILQDTQEGTRPHEGWDSEAGASICRPGGGGRGPANELLHVYEMLLNRGSYHHQEVLKPETAQQLTTRHRIGLFDDTFRHKVDWGLGFIINSNQYGARTVPYGFGLHASPDTFGHGGQQSSVSFADPVHGLAAVLILNGTPGEPRHNRRIRDLLTALYEDLDLA